MQDQVGEQPSLAQSIFSLKMLTCVFIGLSSGFPYYVLAQLVPAWLRTESVDLATIGLFSLILLPYNWKFLWAPFMDRYMPPILGRRTGWMLLTQVSLLFTIGVLGFLQPLEAIWLAASVCVVVAFFSASQDIVIDAFRRELLTDKELGLGTTIHVQAFRISGLVPGALGLILADRFDWDVVFVVIAVFMLIGITATLMFAERQSSGAPKTLKAAVVEPFKDFIPRNNWRGAGLILAFMFFYKLGDNMAVALQTPFLIDLGFSLTTIGLVATDAMISKEDANYLARVSHDGLALAIRPCHTVRDGDTMFAMATGLNESPLDLTSLGAAAVEATAQAVLRAIQQATGLGGIPSISELVD